MSGNTEESIGVSGSGKATVHNNKYMAACDINETTFKQYPLLPISKINSSLDIEVLFHPNYFGEKIQSNEVLKKVGLRGERLSGRLVKVIGEFSQSPYNILEYDLSIELPYNNNSQIK